MEFAQRYAISDTCVLVRDIEKSIAFYTQKLGFILKHRAPGFADFSGLGVTLALWDRDHISGHTGVKTSSDGPANALLAVKIDTPAQLDQIYDALSAKGINFVSPPRDHAWNARGAYFPGPDGELWELYAWLPGGAPGLVTAGAP